MIDFETELRDRFDRVADGAPAGDGLLPIVERRIVAQRRRTTALRVAGVVAVVALAAGVALAATGDDGGDEVPVATDPTTPTEPASTTDPTPPVVESGTWGEIAAAPIGVRNEHVAVDMDGEVLVWSGFGPGPLADAAVHETATDTWRTVPDAPLDAGSSDAVWTGDVAVALAIDPNDAASPYEAAAFDPATDTWTALAAPPALDQDGTPGLVWTGTHVVLLNLVGAARTEVAVYDPATDTWTAGATSTPGTGFGAHPIWAGDEVVVVTSRADDPSSPTSTETAVILAYDPAADTWREIPWALGDAQRRSPAAAWTGTALFVGGGTDGTTALADAALVDLATDTWTPVADAPAGFVGLVHGPPAVWTGSQVVALSDQEGQVGGTPVALDPATGGWAQGPPLPTAPLPFVPAVWSVDRIVLPAGGDTGGAGGLTYAP